MASFHATDARSWMIAASASMRRGRPNAPASTLASAIVPGHFELAEGRRDFGRRLSTRFAHASPRNTANVSRFTCIPFEHSRRCLSRHDFRKPMIKRLLDGKCEATPNDHLGAIEPVSDGVALRKMNLDRHAAIARIEGIMAVQTVNDNFRLRGFNHGECTPPTAPAEMRRLTKDPVCQVSSG
jgi:hypothetical protein